MIGTLYRHANFRGRLQPNYLGMQPMALDRILEIGVHDSGADGGAQIDAAFAHFDQVDAGTKLRNRMCGTGRVDGKFDREGFSELGTRVRAAAGNDQGADGANALQYAGPRIQAGMNCDAIAH